MFKLSKYIATTELDENNKLIYSTRTGEFIKLKSETFNFISQNKLDGICNDTLLALFNSEILVQNEEDEFKTIINSFETASQTNSDIFNYTIQPSANCQLGCEYCGQIHEKLNLTNHQSEKIFQYLKTQIEKNDYKGIHITWYGAEPLMGMDSIRYLSEKLIEFSKSKGIKYDAFIITNGLAMKENIFEELAKYNITNYQITLDGTEQYHDNSRFTKKKGKTFKPILKNIISAVNNPTYEEKKCNILIRCNVHKENYIDINNLIEELYRLNIHDRISMEFAPIHDWGNNNADDEIGLLPEEFAKMEIEYMLKLRKLGFKNKSILLPQRKLNTCMVTNKNSELIDAKGRISYCWETPYTPEFDYENSPFIIGNIKDPSNKKDREELPLGNWYQDIKEKKHGTWCSGCNFLPVCGGSCPINWYKGNPACPSYKFNIEDRLVMQYLEDIEYNFKS